MAGRLYFVAIEIPEPLKREIQLLKESLSVKYDVEHALKTPPHITLQMPMRIEEEKEAELIRALKKLDGVMPSGLVTLSGISSFPERTIFIDVKCTDMLTRLSSNVQNLVRSLDFVQDKIEPISFHPHITLITRDLNKTKYHLAWEELKSMKYEREIHIDEFQLYRHDGKKWQGIRTFRLRDSQKSE